MRISFLLIVLGTALLAAVAVSLLWAVAAILLEWIRERLRA